MDREEFMGWLGVAFVFGIFVGMLIGGALCVIVSNAN